MDLKKEKDLRRKHTLPLSHVWYECITPLRNPRICFFLEFFTQYIHSTVKPKLLFSVDRFDSVLATQGRNQMYNMSDMSLGFQIWVG